MESVDYLYLNILKYAVTGKPYKKSIPENAEKQISTLASRHYTSAFVLPHLSSISTTSFQIQKKNVRQLLLNYYQIEQFTRHIVSLFEQHNISFVLLKGISLAAYYPEPEYRKLGDVDLYINDPLSLSRAKQVLKDNSFIQIDEISDHHLTFLYTFPKTGACYTLELHFRVIGLYQYAPANKLVDQLFSPEHLHPEMQVIRDHSYPVLPPDEYVFYMLHHMLKHYLYSGFGIRLLTDFTFYLNTRYPEISFSRIHSWCRQSHILHFYETILTCCRNYLGLNSFIDSEVTASRQDCDNFLQQILGENDMGTTEASTLVGSGVYRRITPFTWFKEGHLQMHVRFPHLGKCPVLWPILWGITFLCFVKNTYCLRHTTLKDTLHSFRHSNETARQIRIFQDSDC